MDEITVIDYTNENFEEVTIKLNKNLTPSENIQQYFKKYNKSKSRIKELENQIIQTREDINYFDNLWFYINNIQSLDEIEEIKKEIFQDKNKNVKKTNTKKLNLYKFKSEDGTLIYVGRNNIQNDFLTFKFASSKDIWLHAKDVPGSHVIIKTTLDNLTDKTLYQAALLAGFYSKHKLNSKTVVDYTERKNVKKINGSKPGMVTYSNQSSINVNYDKENFPIQIE